MAPGELKFDLETAIAMCRQGGYFEQAAYLATKHGESDMVVDILIEDSKKYSEALKYTWSLEPELVGLCQIVSPVMSKSFILTAALIGLSKFDEICPCTA